MNIYRVALAEEFSSMTYSTTYGVADSVADAGRLALDEEMPDGEDDELHLHLKSIEYIGRCSFGTRG